MSEETVEACCICNKEPLDRGQDHDGRTHLRPYGPGCKPICYNCASATPEMDKIVVANVEAHVKRILDSGDIPVSLSYGMVPLSEAKPRDAIDIIYMARAMAMKEQLEADKFGDVPPTVH